MGLIDLVYEDGQTPLDDDEKEGLLQRWVSTLGELNEAEQRNIEKAVRWTVERRKTFTAAEVLTEAFVRALHKRMFGDVWAWAGTFRNTNKNIGVDKYQVSTALRTLLDNCNYWTANKTFEDDEIALRLKHGIVLIHCFANGNGRHSRLLADVVIEKIFHKEVFSWGSKNLIKENDQRALYLAAIRQADSNNFDALLKFARG